MGSVNNILQANNIHRIDKAKYDAAVMMQKAHNRKEVARSTLVDFTRSLSNQLRVEAAGKEYNEASSQLAATLEGRGMARINASLAASERMGGLAAGAAAAGVGGSSIELLSETVKLQRNIEQDMAAQSTARMAAQGSRAAARIMDNAHSATDLSRDFGNFDYTVHVAPKPMKNRLGKLLGVAVATYFGGPKAGAAVADFAVSSWQASNANFAGAAQSLDSGIANAMQGYQTWSALQGGEGPHSWFGAITQKKNAGETGITWGAYDPEEESLFGSGFGKSFNKNVSGGW